MEPRYKIVYIALGLVASSMLGDVAAYGQASVESQYDGEWLAKVSCTESIYRRPPFTYQAKIPVEKGRIQKTFQNTQEDTTTTNTWTGSFTNNELKIEINGSNSNGEKWRYLLKGELNSPYAVSLIGPYFDARGNKSRTCNIAFNSTKPDELRQAAQRAEQETARLKQELAQKDQALIAAQASTAAARTQAQQGLSQEAQAAIDAQRQAAQRAEQEIARLKEELAQKDRVIEQEQKSLARSQPQVAQNGVQNQSNSTAAPNNVSNPTNPSQLKLSLDKLSVDIGGTRMSGDGEIILKSREGAVAQFDLKITNFDQLERLAKTEIDPAPRNALALLKGYAETAGQDLVWRLRFDNNKLTLNGQDLTSVMLELSRNGGVPVEAYQISRALLNAMPIGLVLDNHIIIEGKLDFATAGDPKGAITISLVGMEQLQTLVSKTPGAQQLGPALALIRGSGDLKDGKVNWTFRFAEQKIFLNSREIAKLALASASQDIANITNSETSISTEKSVDIAQTNFLPIAIIGFTVAALTLLYRKLRQVRWKNLVRHGKVTIYLINKRFDLKKLFKTVQEQAKALKFTGMQKELSVGNNESQSKNTSEKLNAILSRIDLYSRFIFIELLKKMRAETGLVIKNRKIYGWHVVFLCIVLIFSIDFSKGYEFKGYSRKDFHVFLANKAKCIFIFESEDNGRKYTSTYDFRRAEIDSAIAIRTAELASFSRSTKNNVSFSNVSGIARLMPFVILVYGNEWVIDYSSMINRKTTSNLNIEGLGAHPSIMSLWFFDLPDEKEALELVPRINLKIKSCK